MSGDEVTLLSSLGMRADKTAEEQDGKRVGQERPPEVARNEKVAYPA